MEDFWLPEFNALAQYNSEKARGIVHTPEYNKAMEIMQEKYNERLAKFNTAQQSVHLIKSRWAIFLDKLSLAFRR